MDFYQFQSSDMARKKTVCLVLTSMPQTVTGYGESLSFMILKMCPNNCKGISDKGCVLTSVLIVTEIIVT